MNKPRLKLLVNFFLTVLGAVVLASLILYVQNMQIMREQDDRNNEILEAVMEAIDGNFAEADILRNRFNVSNQQDVVVLSEISKNGVFDRVIRYMNRRAYQDACNVFATFVENVDCEYMYVINEQGRIVCSVDPGDLYHSISEKTNISEAEPRLYAGTATVGFDGETVISPIVTHTGFHRSNYTYTTELHGSDEEVRYLVVGFSDDILSMELAILEDFTRVLGSAKAGQAGFVFAVDIHSDCFVYYDDGQSVLTGEYAPRFGVTQDALLDGFSGELTINGDRYYCSGRLFRSEEIGNELAIITAIPEAELLTNSVTAALWPGFIFVTFVVMLWSYGVFVQNVFIRTKETPHSLCIYPIGKRRRARRDAEKAYNEALNLAKKARVEGDTDVRMPEPPKLGKTFYLNITIAKSMVLLTALGGLLVFLSAFFMQTMISTRMGMQYSRSALQAVFETMDETDSTSDSVLDYYNRQYLARAGLLGKLMETNPGAFFAYQDFDHVFVYDDGVNDGLKSISEAPLLAKLCEENKIEAIRLFDEKGRTIASSTNQWDYVLSSDPESDDRELRSILVGRCTEVTRDIYDERSVLVGQCVGSLFHYYTNADGTASDIYAWRDDPEIVTRHRGVLAIYLSADQVRQVRKAVSLEFAADQIVYAKNSKLVIFDDSEEHKVVYSEIPSMIGSSGQAMQMQSNVFSGTFYGFPIVDGVRHFQTVIAFGDYYGAIFTPLSTLYSSRIYVSVITLAVTAICMMLVGAVLSFHDETEEAAYTAVKNSETYRMEYDTVTITTPDGRRRKVKTLNAQLPGNLKWKDRTPEQKLKMVCIMFFVVFAALLGATIHYYLFVGDTNSLTWYIMQGSWTHDFNIFSVCRCAVVFITIGVGIIICDFLVYLFSISFGMRIEALGNLLLSLAKYLTVFAGIFYCLYLYGINGTSLLASAGILSVIIGLGAQSLIGDILAGLFLALEGEIRVGDIVTIGDFTGQVLDIGLRTTKVRDRLLNVKIFNNSTISSVINMTKQLSFAVCEIGIEYDESIARVDDVLRNEFPNLRRSLPMIIDGPYFLGITEFEDSAVRISVSAGCTEQNRITLQRELNRAILDIFQRNHINVPYPQVTISRRETPAESTEEKEAVSV